ncbi:polysaccharide lyase family 4 protein [Mycena polygramma]|nr:polysaccharide lyase family 4 protein [Mycena polygramma]
MALSAPLVSGFGLTVSGTLWTVQTDGGLVFTVQSTNGDITSMIFNGIQTQDQTKFSQISSGLGSASCSWVQTGNENNYIKITCATSTLTYTTAEPSVGELRFIARLAHSALPNGIPQSSIVGGRPAMFYSGVQFINGQVHGVTGSGVGTYFLIIRILTAELNASPTFRGMDDHPQNRLRIELWGAVLQKHPTAFRQGLHGPYLLWVHPTFWAGLGVVSGLVLPAARGFVEGKAIGIPAAYASDTVIGWSNSVDAATADFFLPAMKPGTYTMTLYKGELAVETQSVTVSAATTISSNICCNSHGVTTTYIWQIGEFDGRPTGFLNADMIQTMHPSDSRMHIWGPVTYTVGQRAIGFFPMVIFQAMGPVTIRFALASGQGGARTLKIATTLAFAGRRPVVSVNTWNSSIPAVPDQPDSRGVTRGVYRGNNIEYTYAIPTGVLFTGSTVNVITSPNIVFDAVALF